MPGPSWQLPPLDDILDAPPPEVNRANILSQKRTLERTLADLGYEAKVQQIEQGPRLTRFSLAPDTETRLSKIKNLDQDLAVALGGLPVQIELPTPGDPLLGILVPHGQNFRVALRQVIDTPAFRRYGGALKIGLGLAIGGQPVIADLADMPHLLIGGTTGSGKSACLHAIIAGLLCAYRPNELQFLMIDPLAIELRAYEHLPHLFAPVITRSSQALDTLNTIDKVIDRRYQIFSENLARNISDYNQSLAKASKDTIPRIVLAIDNVFDLMMNSGKEMEQVITRMAQRARGAGVHLMLATPRADTGALSGTLKANFPARIALRVVDGAESRLILDQNGAETLLHQGDMLFKGPNSNALRRLQGVLVSEEERQRLVDFWRSG